MVENKKIAVIPARGGSKRLPKKNIIEFEGKPLIAHTIQAAKLSGLFNKIVVSTDSEEIADISVKWGAEVPSLRQSKADDYSPVSEATIEILEQLSFNGVDFDVVAQMLPVCPLRDSEDIKNALKFFEVKKASFLISCFKFVWMNPWWAFTLNEKNKGDRIFDLNQKRSQDLPELYCPTGAIWIANIESLKNEGTFYGEDQIFWEMEWKKAVDIDNKEDLDLAKAIYRMQGDSL